MEPRRVHKGGMDPGGSTGSTGRYSLPVDVINTAVTRLGFLGLVIAVMGPGAYLFERFAQPHRLQSSHHPFPDAAAIFFVIAGTAMCAAAWSRRFPSDAILDAGLIFQVMVAFAISVSENSSAIPPDQWISGVSWNCLWITMYVVAIPGTYGKMVCAAVASACMAPFGLLLATVANGSPVPRTEQTLALILPPFAAALWSIPVGRYLYRLGTQVSKARAMGSYELIERLGSGGMGEVWRARHRMLARTAAIKLIRPQAFGFETGTDSETIHRRFEREAMATAGLRSPNTVVLYDYGVSQDGTLYYVMELLDGLDLQQLVNGFGAQPSARVVHLLRQAARSLAEAHESGLIHRDIKPSNIFCCKMGIDYDYIKVLDFGLVKPYAHMNDGTRLTRAGVATGTPAYMAPEVAAGASEITPQADLYSLGCVAYLLLTGHMVFDTPGAMAMAIAHMQNEPVPPSQRTDLRIPDQLERLVMCCLEKEPARRPQSARQLEAMLARCGAERWTSDDAESWWLTHVPPRPVLDTPVDGSAPTLVMTTGFGRS